MDTIASRVRQSVKALFVLGYEDRPGPQWEGVVVGYAVNYLRRNAWRVRREMELDDLLQEAYILFLHLQERYPDVSPPHFMALWKSSLHNQLINTARSCGARGRRRTHGMEDAAVEPVARDTNSADLEWRWSLEDAPEPVRRLINQVAQRSRRLKRRKAGQHRETTNAYLCRLAGLPSSTPLRRMLEGWLGLVRE